jgi:hypothetical protein
MRGTIWTEEENETIIQMYSNTPAKDIAAELGKSVISVYNQAYKLGLQKPRTPWNKGLKGEDFISALPKESYERMAKTHKQKGSKPWNKGVKGEQYKQAIGSEALKKMETTFFNKGHSPHNTKPGIGHISVRLDKIGKYYKYIKIADGNWVLYHRYIWEKTHGPIPKGNVVAFIDGDTTNCEISNLKLISRYENMNRNSIHSMPEELIPISRMKGRLTRKLNQLKSDKTN